MVLFQNIKQIQAEEPSSIDFKSKRFYLSGNFSSLKKEVGEKLEKVDAIHVTTFTLKDIDYLILADNGVKKLGQKQDFGDKARKVQAHNEKDGQVRHIPIIKESHFNALLEAAMNQQPKPL